MERFTSIPTTATGLLVVAQQLLDSSPTYDTATIPTVLTSKRTAVGTLAADVSTKQTDADTKNAAYQSAKNVYTAARDLLTSAKEGLSDAVESLRNHVLSAVAQATSGMTAEQLATFEIDTGISLTEPLLFLPPVAPVLVSAQIISGSQGYINWNPVVATEAGNCEAKAYLVEYSEDNQVSWNYVAIEIGTEGYVDTASKTHFRITSHGNAGKGGSLFVAVADFT